MSQAYPRFNALRLVAGAALLAALASCGGNNYPTLQVPNSLVVSDLNGDGLPDIAVAIAQIDTTGLTQQPGFVSIILNQKSSPGNFSPGISYNSSPMPPSGIAVGDVMGTGAKDLVVSNNAASTVSLMTETSPTSAAYNAAKTISTIANGQPNLVVLADLNNDGAPDIVVADGAGFVDILLQDPHNRGNFGAAITLPVPTRGISVAVDDLNGDGLPDIVVTSFDLYGDTGAVQVFFQNPGATSSSVSFQAPVTVATGCEPSQVRIADLTGTGTGLKSILVACQGLAQVSSEQVPGLMVIPQTSTGVFGTAVVYPTSAVVNGVPPIGGMSLAIGDLNGDGLPDVAMSSMYPQGQGTIFVMTQDPANPGTFPLANVSSYAGLGQPSRIELGDLNGDGLPDIVVSDANTAGVLMNNYNATPGKFSLQETQVGY